MIHGADAIGHYPGAMLLHSQPEANQKSLPELGGSLWPSELSLGRFSRRRFFQARLYWAANRKDHTCLHQLLGRTMDGQIA